MLEVEKRSQLFITHAQRNAFRHDALIRVYDDAGNVIETHDSLLTVIP